MGWMDARTSRAQTAWREPTACVIRQERERLQANTISHKFNPLFAQLTLWRVALAISSLLFALACTIQASFNESTNLKIPRPPSLWEITQLQMIEFMILKKCPTRTNGKN